MLLRMLIMLIHTPKAGTKGFNMFIAIDGAFTVYKLRTQSDVVEFAERLGLKVDSSQHLNIFQDVQVSKKHASHYAQKGYALYLRDEDSPDWTYKVVSI